MISLGRLKTFFSFQIYTTRGLCTKNRLKALIGNTPLGRRGDWAELRQVLLADTAEFLGHRVVVTRLMTALIVVLRGEGERLERQERSLACREIQHCQL